MLEITYNPFGIKENNFKSSYKHKFPSGMCDKLEVRHKADNSVYFFSVPYLVKIIIYCFTNVATSVPTFKI